MMDIINITPNNIDSEHICCAISNAKNNCCEQSKKYWMKEHFSDGLTFKRLDTRGKALIEYIPAENAWCPIDAPGYLFINCFWVAGKLKGQGYSNQLLGACIADAKEKGKKGLVILSSKKKMSFLSDPKYLRHKSFKVCDEAAPYYQLYYLPFDENTDKPTFKNCCKNPKIDRQGVVIYYSNQCPYTEKYVPMLEPIAKEKDIPITLIKITSKETAQNAPAPFTTYSLFLNGEFITEEILSEAKFKKLLDEKDGGGNQYAGNT